MPPRTPGPSQMFVARVTDASAAPQYQFVESWLVSGVWVDKAGSRYGGANNPAVAITGLALSVDDYFLCSPADGEGGTKWQALAKLPGSSSPAAYRLAAAVVADAAFTPYVNPLTVPRGDYLVTGQLAISFTSGGTVHFGLGATNRAASPAAPRVPATTSRQDGATGAFVTVSVSQVIAAGQYDDDGSTPNVDIKAYLKVDSGAASFAVNQLNALAVRAGN